MPPRTHVFAGPSLGHDRIAALAPDAVVHPPVAHGELLRLGLRPGDRVVLLDGVFQQSASVRHKEILDVLGHGVAVAGAASMGALRAAELAPFGMTGHGVVYRLYALGLLDADDEVAVLHDDGGDWTPRTVALVSVRFLARRMRRRGLLSTDEEQRALAAARATPFALRSHTALTESYRAAGLPPRAVQALHEAMSGDRETWDIKTQDAVRAFIDSPGLPRRTTAPWPVTGYLAQWRAHPEQRLSLVVTAAQLWADDYPFLHRRVTLHTIAGSRSPGFDAPYDMLAEAAGSTARQRGLVPTGDLAALHRSMRGWLGPDESYPSADLLLATVLARSFRWAPDLTPLPLLYEAVKGTPGAEHLCRLVDRAEAFNEELARRGYPVARATRESLHRFVLDRWGVAGLSPVLYDRGFTDIDDLYRRGRPLCAYSVLQGPPVIRLLA